MEKQANSKGIILNYGLYLGIAGVFIHLIFYATGNLISLGWLSGIIGIVAMIVLIALGIKKFKADNGGFLTFGQALKVGVGIAVISGIISSIYTLVFTNMIDPSIQEQALELQRQAWIDSGLNEDQIEASEAMTKKMQSPIIAVPFAIIFSAFLGFVFSAICGAIMKKTEESDY
ncbi:DUF4199 domain-containing protein [Tenacibaculum aiptasiae]|uniref:DUF4199 domain-containing protein n=1 Tax=Tenacibaculum aiptasiae TaxID=426481 RepID=A0A7J5AQL6_9FLAO|nr:DUF4199 domain-containing protein [Tenacibaculum aiptasiae]KAB1159323.1 DUF4199 domain-containing protein [Tenacibaculum aiptasiae]